jgi:large subunit ribosomal protein L4
MNRKEKRAALKSALSSRLADNNMIVVDKLTFDEIKTKRFVEVMENLNVNRGIVVLEDSDKNVVMSGKNVASISTTIVDALNVYDVMKCGTVVLTKAAAKKIEEVYA